MALSLSHGRGSFMVIPREVKRLPRHTINHIQRSSRCLLMAQSGHHATEFQCPLLGVKRTSGVGVSMSVIDPKRTSGTSCVGGSLSTEPKDCRISDLY